MNEKKYPASYSKGGKMLQFNKKFLQVFCI